MYLCNKQSEMNKDISLQKRIARLAALKEEFGLSQERIAEKAGLNRVTIAKVLTAKDERYHTESNVVAVEKAIEKVLEEYRKKLCK